MIKIIHVVDDVTTVYMEVNATNARSLRQAIFSLIELRHSDKQCFECGYTHLSWIEVDGYKVHDSLLLVIDKEVQARKFLANLRDYLHLGERLW